MAALIWDELLRASTKEYVNGTKKQGVTLNKLKALWTKLWTKEKPYPTVIKNLNRGSDYFLNWEKRQIVGHTLRLKVGDGIRAKLDSGRNGIFRVIAVRRYSDPANMYFADVEDVGYEDELQAQVK